MLVFQAMEAIFEHQLFKEFSLPIVSRTSVVNLMAYRNEDLQCKFKLLSLVILILYWV